ncbi:hypothetical protein MN116_007956 [Schistosoma mekongi]|uniref:EF-hand domain-containing protein n=1 Tax=Schistosoma mekongi TaxID=38744 RepID=A0AAE1Z740_SCHME|nr:hypothetical protein MN116_007956 [Schistosoma mekongi]
MQSSSCLPKGKPTIDEIKVLFEFADNDKSGKISSKELKRILELGRHSPLCEENVKEFMKKYDLDGDQEWSIDELIKFFSE